MKKLFLFSMVVGLVIAMGVMPSSSMAKDPVKLGFFAPLTGFAAQTGRDMLNGVEVYLKENPEVAGRKIVLVTEDSEAKPAVALTKVRKLVEKDGCHVVFGGLMASTGYALQPYVDKKKVPTNYS